MRVIDQITNLESCIYDAQKAKGDHVNYVLYPLENDGLDAFITNCEKEIAELEKLDMMDNITIA